MTKYAQASKVSVQMRRERDRLVVVVADDGVGGADPLGGTGLSGLDDGIAALDGARWVESPPRRRDAHPHGDSLTA